MEREPIEVSEQRALSFLIKRFRNLDNLSRYGLNNGKLIKRVHKKSSMRDLFVVLNLDKHGNVLHVPGYDDEGQASE